MKVVPFNGPIRITPKRLVKRNFGALGCPVVARRAKRSGLGLLIGASANNSSQATKSISDAGSGASLGATVGSVVPGIGTAIGAAVGAAIGAIGSLFGPAKEGQAAMTWDDMVAHNYLSTTKGTGFDERYFGEALKGAMDKGKNVWGAKCGADGYQNPDCFYSQLAKTIINGYLNKQVPLTADEPTVWNTVVLPWLQSGAGGYINWGTLNNEKIQQLLILAATDRYINGLPITRANMPSYTTQQANYASWSTPPITVALASLLNPPAATPAPPPMANTQPVPQTVLAATPAPVQTGVTASGSPIVAPNDTNAMIAQLIAQGQTQNQAMLAAMQSLAANNINPNTPQVQGQLQAAVSGSATGLSTNTLLLAGGAALALVLFMRKGK